MYKIKTNAGKLKVYQSIISLLLCLVFSKGIMAQPVISLTPVITTGLSSPIQLVNAGDSSRRIFIVQQGGSIRAYDSAFNFLSVFLSVSGVNFEGERGLLSMAFHPDYKNNGLFYVYYVNTAGNLELARYQVSDSINLANPASKVILITIPHPTNANHNGGELHFGNDGCLYLSTGDGGGAGDTAGNAQNQEKLLGKILRFNVNTSPTAPYYSIPPGNPFSNEIFALGLRNPFRWSFDRLTHDMWIGDVGQNSWEEINFRAAGTTAGVNYGWRCYEGNVPFNTAGCGPQTDYVSPVFTYPTQSPAAVTGGIVYRGSAYPALQGYNISADFFSGTFYKTVSNGSGGWSTTTQTLTPAGIVDFGETENGEAYAVSLTESSVYKIGASGPLPEILLKFNGNVNTAGVTLNWQTGVEENIRNFEIEFSTDGTTFTHVTTLTAHNAAGGSVYSYVHSTSFDGVLFYRLKMTDQDGAYKYSAIIRVELHARVKNIVLPSIINNGMMNINLGNAKYTLLELLGINGARFLKQNVAGKTGQLKVPVATLPAGIYLVRLTGNKGMAFQKILIQ